MDKIIETYRDDADGVFKPVLGMFELAAFPRGITMKPDHRIAKYEQTESYIGKTLDTWA